MTPLKDFSRHLLVITFALFTIQCGQEGASSQLGVALNPTRPEVKLYDRPVNVGTPFERQLTNPWIGFNMQLTNNTGSNLFIIALTFKVISTKEGKSVESTSYGLNPENFLDANGDPQTQFITELGTTDATKVFKTGNIYIDGLPNANKKEADSFFFRIEGEIEALVGPDVNNPTDGFTKKIQINTTR